MDHIVKIDNPGLEQNMRMYLQAAANRQNARVMQMDYFYLIFRIGIAALLEYMHVTIDFYDFAPDQRTEQSIATTILNKYNELTHQKTQLQSLVNVGEYEDQIVPVIKYHMERRAFLNNVHFIDRMHDQFRPRSSARSSQSEVFGNPSLTDIIRSLGPPST